MTSVTFNTVSVVVSGRKITKFPDAEKTLEAGRPFEALPGTRDAISGT